MKFTDKLRKIGACSAAVKWAEQYPTLQKAWDVCERGDWMLWLAGRKSGNPEIRQRKKLVLCSCDNARLVWKYMGKKAKHCVITTEKWAKGIDGVTIEDVMRVADATYATYSTYATSTSASASASAAAASYAAYAAAANAAAAAYAAYAAASAANAANAAASAAYAAYAAAAYAAADAYAVAAANAADAADAAYVASVAAQIKTLRKCAKIVRKYYPKAPRI